MCDVEDSEAGVSIICDIVHTGYQEVVPESEYRRVTGDAVCYWANNAIHGHIKFIYEWVG